MEQEELARLEAHQAKKGLERTRRTTRVASHQKIVARTMAKKYMSNAKANCYTLLKDTSFFYDRRIEEGFKCNLMPWLLEQTEKFVKELQEFDRYPGHLMDNYLEDQADVHKNTVQAHADKVEAAKRAAEEAERQRIADKLRRKQERAAARKAAEIQALKEQIHADYIAKSTPVEGIVFNDIIDIDGHGTVDKNQVTVLGGYLGQFMIVLNTIAKHYRKLDSTTPKSQASSRRAGSENRPTSQGSDARSQGQMSDQQPKRKIFDSRVIQGFLYNYILEKLKVERLQIQVDSAFEKFLNNLKVPMQLNEMRTMKEPNWTHLRELIRSTYQSKILKLIHDYADYLGLEEEVFDLVFEGFWDIYTFKPQVAEVSGKKMLNWIPKVLLKVNETTVAPE